jgi:TRAP-type transport system periplasmic protein
MLQLNARVQFAVAVLTGTVMLATPGQAETVLRFATTLPEGTGAVKEFFEPWANKISADSGGELRIEIVNGPTIADARNAYERVVSGVVDIAWGTQGAFAVPFPKTTVVSLPFIGSGDQTVPASKALWKLYESGLLDEEYAAVKPLAFVSPGITLHASKPVNSLEDLAGMKVGVNGAESSDTMSMLGASPQAVVGPDLYQTLGTGVIDAVVMPYSGLVTFKLQEVTSDHIEVNLGGGAGMIFMNRDAYDALSDKAKAAIDANSGVETSGALGQWFDGFDNAARDLLNATDGQAIHGLDDKEAARWKEATAGLKDAWIAKTEGGQQVYDTFSAALAEAAKGN